MPGAICSFGLDLDEALAVLACVVSQPSFPDFLDAPEREALVAEAQRMVMHAALAAVVRSIPPPVKQEPRLRLVKDGHGAASE
jgi:hypothetical protein